MTRASTALARGLANARESAVRVFLNQTRVPGGAPPDEKALRTLLAAAQAVHSLSLIATNHYLVAGDCDTLSRLVVSQLRAHAGPEFSRYLARYDEAKELPGNGQILLLSDDIAAAVDGPGLGQLTGPSYAQLTLATVLAWWAVTAEVFHDDAYATELADAITKSLRPDA